MPTGAPSPTDAAATTDATEPRFSTAVRRALHLSGWLVAAMALGVEVNLTPLRARST